MSQRLADSEARLAAASKEAAAAADLREQLAEAESQLVAASDSAQVCPLH